MVNVEGSCMVAHGFNRGIIGNDGSAAMRRAV